MHQTTLQSVWSKGPLLNFQRPNASEEESSISLAGIDQICLPWESFISRVQPQKCCLPLTQSPKPKPLVNAVFHFLTPLFCKNQIPVIIPPKFTKLETKRHIKLCWIMESWSTIQPGQNENVFTEILLVTLSLCSKPGILITATVASLGIITLRWP